jgi:hypothetical protein
MWEPCFEEEKLSSKSTTKLRPLVLISTCLRVLRTPGTAFTVYGRDSWRPNWHQCLESVRVTSVDGTGISCGTEGNG